MQQPPNDYLGQQDATRRPAESLHSPGGVFVDHKAIIAVVLFVVLGTLAVYIGFQTLPAPKNTVMEPMLGMADGKMDSMSSMSDGKANSMPTMTADNTHSMPGMSSGSTHAVPSMTAGTMTDTSTDNTQTLEAVQAYFRDTFGNQAAYATITGYSVDQTALTIQTNIKGMSAAAMASGHVICDVADQLVMHGNTAIKRYQVLNHDGARLCGAGS